MKAFMKRCKMTALGDGQGLTGVVQRPRLRSPLRSPRTQRYRAQAMKMLDNTVVANDADTLQTFLVDNLLLEMVTTDPLLHKACQCGHIECVRVLLEHGVPASSTDQQGMTALHYAVLSDNPDMTEACIDALLAYGANINTLGDSSKWGKAPLHMAIEREDAACVRALIRRGCQVNIVSECEKGISPLLLAVKQHNVAIVRALLVAGADLRRCWNWKCTMTPPVDLLTHRMSREQSNSGDILREMFKLLLQADGDPLQSLNLMPQEQQCKTRTLDAIRTVLNRLDGKFHAQARDFIVMLVLQGYRPRDDALALLQSVDIATYWWVLNHLAAPPSLRILCSRKVRRAMRFNVLHGCHHDSLAKVNQSSKDCILLLSIPKPSPIIGANSLP